MADISQLHVGETTYDIKDTIARIQKTTLPTASASEAGHIYQYIGATGNGLVNGYFYKCVNNDGTYEWAAISVQNGGGGGGSSITVSSTLTLTVNGWDSDTMQQTVLTTIDTTKRNVIDITVSELPTWSAYNVYAISESSTGVTFQCDDIPSEDLTFKITSMEVVSANA